MGVPKVYKPFQILYLTMTSRNTTTHCGLEEEAQAFPMPQVPVREDTQESIDYYEDDDGYGDYDDFNAQGMAGGGGGGNSRAKTSRQQKKENQRDNSGNHGPYSAKHTRLVAARQEQNRSNSTTAGTQGGGGGKNKQSQSK